jgi:uncharacterized repeat protein (TIGR01451 family)
MNRGARLIGYLLVLFALAALLVAIPSAWATPEQSQSAQTIPTRTPKPATATPAPAKATDTPQPTDAPRATRSPTDIPTVLPGTQAPPLSAATPAAASATPVTAAALVLKKEVAPAAAWPGATLHYTLTLTNRGNASARQVAIQDTLPDELVPGAVAAEPNAHWEGQTLHAQALVLPPGSQLVIAYTAQVRVNARPGSVISNSASAAAAGNLRAAAGASVSLPPAELPPTGGSLAGFRRAAALVQ